jgi:hypothetical protein
MNRNTDLNATGRLTGACRRILGSIGNFVVEGVGTGAGAGVGLERPVLRYGEGDFEFSRS